MRNENALSSAKVGVKTLSLVGKSAVKIRYRDGSRILVWSTPAIIT